MKNKTRYKRIMSLLYDANNDTNLNLVFNASKKVKAILVATDQCRFWLTLLLKWNTLDNKNKKGSWKRKMKVDSESKM